MMKKLTALLLILAITVLIIPASMADQIWYVYAENGGSLNVRSTPNGEWVGRIPYGDAVDVINYVANGWSKIYFESSTYRGEAYVSSRYLVRNRPYGPVTPTPTPAPAPAPAEDTTLRDMNREYRSARRVSPYTIVARPARASGYVNLRWGPSTQTEQIRRCYQGKELTVLAEMNNWFQVQDPDTGMVGFISRKYVTVR